MSTESSMEETAVVWNPFLNPGYMFYAIWRTVYIYILNIYIYIYIYILIIPIILILIIIIIIIIFYVYIYTANMQRAPMTEASAC